MNGGINNNYNNKNIYEYNPNKSNANFEDSDIDLEAINFLYSTDKLEDERTTFEDTFKMIDANDESSDGAKFLNGLRDNKAQLQEELGLTDEEYDNLACIALALASQETGMGDEAGYALENSWLGGPIRKAMKWIDIKTGGGSASSGLTQMRIYDFMHSEQSPLTDEQKALLNEYGIVAEDFATNNLFANPDKAAIASMIVLTNIYENYDNYKNVLSTEHTDIETRLGLVTDEDKQNAEIRGEKILYDITSLYNQIETPKEKVKIREAIKDLFLAIPDGSKLQNINEDKCLKHLNNLLEKNSASFTLTTEDLEYIRYELTTQETAFTPQEYCAYGWNKGTQESGMKPDRIISDTIGTILKNPEDFDYDQFTVNVSTLAQKYIEQTM